MIHFGVSLFDVNVRHRKGIDVEGDNEQTKKRKKVGWGTTDSQPDRSIHVILNGRHNFFNRF